MALSGTKLPNFAPQLRPIWETITHISLTALTKTRALPSRKPAYFSSNFACFCFFLALFRSYLGQVHLGDEFWLGAANRNVKGIFAMSLLIAEQRRKSISADLRVARG